MFYLKSHMRRYTHLDSEVYKVLDSTPVLQRCLLLINPYFYPEAHSYLEAPILIPLFH